MAQTPKPTASKMLQGRFSASHDPNFEPIPAAELGDPPEEWKADGVERREWAWALESCPAGMLRSADRRMLVAWCETCAEWDWITAEIRKHKLVSKNRNGNMVPNAYATLRDKCSTRMRRYADLLGFSPTARTRIQLPAQPARSSWSNLQQKTETPPEDKAA